MQQGIPYRQAGDPANHGVAPRRDRRERTFRQQRGAPHGGDGGVGCGKLRIVVACPAREPNRPGYLAVASGVLPTIRPALAAAY